MDKKTYVPNCIFCGSKDEFYYCIECQNIVRNKLEGLQVGVLSKRKVNFMPMPTHTADDLPPVVRYKNTEDLLISFQLNNTDEYDWKYAINLVVYSNKEILNKDILNLLEIRRTYCNTILLVDRKDQLKYEGNKFNIMSQQYRQDSIINWFIKDTGYYAEDEYNMFLILVKDFDKI